MTMHKLVNGIECPLSEDDVLLIEQMEAEKDERQWAEIRIQRNALLDKCDWWVTRAIETNATISAEQQAYRDALRDITSQSDPFNIVWPALPSAGG